MAKWKVELETIVEAETRAEAWKVSRQVFEQTLDYIAQVKSVGLEPVPKPKEWVAINEQSKLNQIPALLKRIKG